MSRYSPQVLPSGAPNDAPGDIVRALEMMQQDRRQKRLDQEHAEDREYQRTQRAHAESDRETQALIRNLELRRQGVVTTDQAERVSRPDRFGNVVRDLKGNEVRTIDPARYSRVGAAGGQTYLEDNTLTPEGRKEEQYKRLRDTLRTGDPVEIAARTGDLRALEPKEWKPTTREEAEGFYANTTLANTRQSNSASVALENLREENRRKRGEGGTNWQTIQTADGFVQVDPRTGQTRPLTDASGKTLTPRVTAPKPQDDAAFRERRVTIGKTLFPTGVSTSFQQDLVDELASGKTKAQVLADMRAAGVPANMIQEAERALPDHRLGRMGLK